MMVERIYRCKDCGKIFETYAECLEHSDIHASKSIFVCDMCGNEFKYIPSHMGYDYEDTNILHIFSNDICGHGSKFDGSNISFKLCDDCLLEFVQRLKQSAQDRILTPVWKKDIHEQFDISK